ncbi:MAG: DEAD/DEAH box helicase family protein [Erysipelotrichaceae bacterium]
MYKNILQFDGTWRKYQQRILDRYNDYKMDGKVHIIAPPGSGKTTLGIELIRLMNEPCLILVPTITIREQWVKRIEEAFLSKKINTEDVISQNLKQMKLINVSTYQSIHSAMKHYKGDEIEEIDEETSYREEVDFETFDLLKELSIHKINTLCLDECHHLRSEWWRALENFKKHVNIRYTISLTATPPYDSTPEMWLRYMSMCGEIDEEISVAELVKDKNLCPHQDYVYLNYPTQEELAKLKDLEVSRNALMKEIMQDDEFEKIILSHSIFTKKVDLDSLLEDPSYLSSILIYANEKKHRIPRIYKQLLNYVHLEKMSAKWLEILLQNVFYKDTLSYDISKSSLDHYIAKLKTYHLIENRKVTLVSKPSIKNQLMRSIGKCESIKEITFHEYKHMNTKLRLLILCDYIKKEDCKTIGNPNFNVHSIGVIPIFELLRRENVRIQSSLKLGVLCGSIAIIPNEACDRLLELAPDKGDISFQSIGNLKDQSYVEVLIKGNRHCLTQIMTTLFEEGKIEALIGTKSLLGEGWDSPCINSLILASFIGSFMLSNQMRGRAIRSYKKDPQKTSNIWHLACIELPKINSNQQDREFEEYDDIVTLSRRMDHFIGLHYSQNVIETGIERIMDISHFNESKSSTNRFNAEMLKRSSDRETLSQRWQDSLALVEEMQIAQEVSVNNKVLTAFFLTDFKRIFLFSIIFSLILQIELNFLLYHLSISAEFLYLLVGSTLAITLFYYLLVIKQFIGHGSPIRSLKRISMGIRKAILSYGAFETFEHRVESSAGPLASMAYLKGGSGHDQALFAKTLAEFFEVIDNQRYLLYSSKHKHSVYGYFVIPDLFSKRKEDAVFFNKMMKPFIGKYQVVYTRNSEGRKILLRGRKKAFSNIQERTMTNKKVKSALE